MKRLASILVWSAISAAFIGPGTVATAARAGAGYGLALLWAVVFSTVACLLLQEASARVTIATGLPLGQVIRNRFGRQRWVPVLVVGSVVLGCAAYQMGNILGAVSGAALGSEVPRFWLVLAIGVAAGGTLFAGPVTTVARILGVVVAMMGVAFLACAVLVGPAVVDVARGVIRPSLPVGAGVLALGLVGTTVVPYNLFLGSGLARGQSLADARLGLAVAIPLGGLITMAVLVVGTVVAGEFSFVALADALAERLGHWARPFFAFGLFAAGFSSAVTAPLAAALSVRGFSGGQDDDRWGDRSARFRLVWGGVLLFGLVGGLTGVAPIPAIILAQALNGVLLPLVAVVLWVAVNDRQLVGDAHRVGLPLRILLGLATAVTCVLGTAGVVRAASRALGRPAPGEGWLLLVGAVVAAGVAVWAVRDIRRSA